MNSSSGEGGRPEEEKRGQQGGHAALWAQSSEKEGKNREREILFKQQGKNGNQEDRTSLP